MVSLKLNDPGKAGNLLGECLRSLGKWPLLRMVLRAPLCTLSMALVV